MLSVVEQDMGTMRYQKHAKDRGNEAGQVESPFTSDDVRDNPEREGPDSTWLALIRLID